MRAMDTTAGIGGSLGALQLVSWAAQLASAAILGQTLFFKFTYAPETQYIFARLGGRPAATVTGFMELACVILLLVPKTPAWGALLALVTISGALATHLFILGIEVIDPTTGRGDGGLLFGLAIAVAALSLTILAIRRAEWVPVLLRLAGR